MTVARNPITGALLKTKPATDQYRNNYDAIFAKKPAEEVKEEKPKKAKKQ